MPSASCPRRGRSRPPSEPDAKSGRLVGKSTRNGHGVFPGATCTIRALEHRRKRLKRPKRNVPPNVVGWIVWVGARRFCWQPERLCPTAMAHGAYFLRAGKWAVAVTWTAFFSAGNDMPAHPTPVPTLPFETGITSQETRPGILGMPPSGPSSFSKPGIEIDSPRHSDFRQRARVPREI